MVPEDCESNVSDFSLPGLIPRLEDQDDDSSKGWESVGGSNDDKSVAWLISDDDISVLVKNNSDINFHPSFSKYADVDPHESSTKIPFSKFDREI